MPLFYRNLNDFSPLFRLADEFERAVQPLQPQSNGRSFAPRFDLKESKEAYELHGELPGIEQSNINIEWTDDSTLIVSGHTATTHESKSPEVSETTEGSDAGSETNYQKPSVEVEGESSSAVTKQAENTEVSKTADANATRWWITERSTGSFQRTFQFPSRVDHDAVKASLKNGVLNVLIPKAKVREPRKINIE